tara:strand:- start:141 stop:692 length:552 start_codon:yes stop_codon:yes gene_type:complete
MPKRKQKKYTKPKRPFDKVRIQEEGILIKKYGLKNKKEIWRADSAINKIRKQAKLLLTKSSEDQEAFVSRLKKQGFKIENIADVLGLEKENHLKRRLQSVVVAKSLARTAKQARQFITHKNIAIDNKIVSIPSYLVPIDEEDKITLKLVKKEKKQAKPLVEEGAEEETKQETKETVGEEKENA